MRRSSRAQRIVFRLPPYDTPRAARCNKAKFRVHRRHAAGGVCEQRITALRIYIHRFRWWFWLTGDESVLKLVDGGSFGEFWKVEKKSPFLESVAVRVLPR